MAAKRSASSSNTEKKDVRKMKSGTPSGMESNPSPAAGGEATPNGVNVEALRKHADAFDPRLLLAKFPRENPARCTSRMRRSFHRELGQMRSSTSKVAR